MGGDADHARARADEAVHIRGVARHDIVRAELANERALQDANTSRHAGRRSVVVALHPMPVRVFQIEDELHPFRHRRHRHLENEVGRIDRFAERRRQERWVFRRCSESCGGLRRCTGARTERRAYAAGARARSTGTDVDRSWRRGPESRRIRRARTHHSVYGRRRFLLQPHSCCRATQPPHKGPVLLVHGAGVRANIFRPPGASARWSML